MSESDSKVELPRSTLLMNRHDSALIVIDVQEKLLPHIANHEQLQWGIGRLVEGAGILNVPVFVTEQYPRGLGPTDNSILNLLNAPPGSIHEKTMFSCRQCDSMVDSLVQGKIANVMLAGIETHVCIMQSALDLLALGFNVFVCVDATGSRVDLDRDTALRRMESSGINLATTEMALFEWCADSSIGPFKKISQLVKGSFD